MSEADGMEDAVDGAMRTGLMVASRIGEQLARMREEEHRNIAAAEEQRARGLQGRFDAQRAAARAQLAPVVPEDWWDKTTPDMIERAHETATAWKAYDPEAAKVSEQIRDQVPPRYGIDIDKTGANESAVSDALTRAGANRDDRRVRAEHSEPSWDSAERRQRLAETLEGKGDREAVNARLLADKHQGTHPGEAVAHKPTLATTSKMAKAAGKRRTMERGGLER